MIHFKDISKTFASKKGTIKAIDHLSLSIHQNEVFGIIGESGAGKSTLLRFINALETPDEGLVEVNGVDVQSLNPKELRQFKKKIGMIFQQFNLLGNKTDRKSVV